MVEENSLPAYTAARFASFTRIRKCSFAFAARPAISFRKKAVGEMPDPELAMARASPVGQVTKRPMAVFAASTHQVRLWCA